MLFAQVVGQEKLKNDIINIIQQGMIPHATMFLGKTGWGTLPFALAFAQFLMCEQPTENDACGICQSCKQSEKLEHPDIRYTFPVYRIQSSKPAVSKDFYKEFKSFAQLHPYGNVPAFLHYINAENKQGNISAEEARTIIESLNLKSYQGGKKIHIIWMPEFLGDEGNILLKLIEEPPNDTYIIFIAEEENKVIQTILSRVQKFRLKPLHADEISAALIHQASIPAINAQQIANTCEGNYATALQLVENWDNDFLPIALDFITMIAQNQGALFNTWVDQVAKMGREEIKILLQYIQQVFAQAFRSQYSPTLIQHLPENEKKLVQQVVNLKIAYSGYQDIMNGFNEVIYKISRNANAKLQLLTLIINMQYWIKSMALNVSFKN